MGVGKVTYSILYPTITVLLRHCVVHTVHIYLSPPIFILCLPIRLALVTLDSRFDGQAYHFHLRYSIPRAYNVGPTILLLSPSSIIHIYCSRTWSWHQQSLYQRRECSTPSRASLPGSRRPLSSRRIQSLSPVRPQKESQHHMHVLNANAARCEFAVPTWAPWTAPNLESPADAMASNLVANVFRVVPQSGVSTTSTASV